MPHVAAPHRTHLTADRLWTAVTAALSALSLVLVLAEAYDPAAVVALLAVLSGGWAMLISTTRAERFETVTATVLAGVVLAVGLAYGSGL